MEPPYQNRAYGQLRRLPADPARYPERYEYNETTKTLIGGDGNFRPVAPLVWEFEVSGLKVLQSWLDYRMKKGHGKKSSPLDDVRPERWTNEFTTELLELLWVLEATAATYPKQAELLEKIIKGPVFQADELPLPEAQVTKPGQKLSCPDLFAEQG